VIRTCTYLCARVASNPFPIKNRLEYVTCVHTNYLKKNKEITAKCLCQIALEFFAVQLKLLEKNAKFAVQYYFLKRIILSKLPGKMMY